MTPQPAAVSVTLPFSQALDRVKKVLFQPFDIGRWFVIGFCAWLANLGKGGGFHGSYNFGGHNQSDVRSVQDQFEHVRHYVMNNLGWIAPLAIALVVVSLILWVVILFLSSRGRFMFLHCVALNTAEVQVPWHKYAAQANSLFVVRIILSLVGAAVLLPVLGGLLVVVVRMVVHQAPTVGGIFAAILLVLGLIVISVVCWVVSRVLDDFIVPFQFLRRSSCRDAWREFKGLAQGNIGNLLLYLLFRILLGLGIGLAVFAVVIATCCIAGCLFALPYLGTVCLLPILVLERSYSLHYLAQFGPGYDVFSLPATAG